MRWTYIDPTTVFNPFIGFQTVLIALIGGAATLWGPLIAAVVFSVLAETLRLQLPQLYMMALGLLLILSVLYLPGGLASLRAGHARGWWRDVARRPVRVAPWLNGCSRRAASRCASAAWSRSMPSARPSTPASWSASSARTARARPRSSTRSPASSRRPAGGSSRSADDLTGAKPHRYAQHGIARTFQTPRVFAELPVAANIDFGLQFAGRARKGSWLLRDAPSILALIGLAAQAALPAARDHAVAAAPARDRHGARDAAAAAAARRSGRRLTENEVEAMAQLIRRLRDELELTVSGSSTR